MTSIDKLAKDVCVCPFNKLHVLPAESLQRHIIKCMVNYPNHKTCPYNAMHRFLNEQDFVKHLLECPDKKIEWVKLEHRQHGDLTQRSMDTALAQKLEKFNLEFENWDEN